MGCEFYIEGDFAEGNPQIKKQEDKMEKTKQYVTPKDFFGRIPIKQAIPLGLQHVLAMFVGNLTPILIISSACVAAGGGAEEFAAVQVALLQNAMLVAGIVTLVQLFAIGPVGGRVPIIMGTSSGFIGVFKSVTEVMGGGIAAYAAIMGASILGGLFETVLGALATGDPVKCAVNPLTGHETKYPALKKDGEGKTVAVVGGGIAGMQAAVVLAKRGFKTVLFEQSGVLGGQLNIADKPPMKTMITELITAFKCECENQHVEIRLNTRAEKEEILAMNPYGVVIATGGEPLVIRSIKGIEKAIVNDQVLSGKAEIKDEKVIVVGGSFNGLETAEFLAEKGNQVTVVEMMPQMGKDIYFQNLIDMMARIQALGIELKPGSQLVEVTDDGIVIKDVETGTLEELKADKVVLSMGTRPVNILEGELADKTKVVVIGDAKKIGRIGDATRSGYEAGLNL